MAQTPSFFKNRRKLKEAKQLKARIESLIHSSDKLAQEIAVAREDLFNEQVETKLRYTSANVLREYRSGARIQPISSYSLWQVLHLSYWQLSNISGIGEKSAGLIQQCANSYATWVRQNHRLIISPDMQTPKATKLLQKIYEFDNLREIVERALELGERSQNIEDLLKGAKPSAHPLLWLLSRKKNKAIDNLEEIESLLQSPLAVEVAELEQKKSAILWNDHKKYWEAFYKDSARYYSILAGNFQTNSQTKRRSITPEEASWKSDGQKRNGINEILDGLKRYDSSAKNRVSKESEPIEELDPLDPALREEIEHVKLDTKGLRCVLRPYQVFGTKYILNQRNVLLGDEMGLGKTIEAIAAMVTLRNRGNTHFLVVCPASVLINWEREISKHSDLRKYVLHGNNYDEQLERWVLLGGVAITNFENAKRFDYQDGLAMVVVDEAHYIKNKRAARTRNTVAILRKTRRKLFMTGTPLENKLDEMVELISLLQPEIAEKIAKMGVVKKEVFRHEVAPVYFRRTKDSVWMEMPELQVIEDVVELTSSERKLYLSLVMERTMAAFAKMRQVSFEVENDSESSKLTRIQEICEEAFENGRKVLIFSFYLNTIQRVQKTLGDRVFGPITGSISPEERQKMIDRFSEKEGGAVLLSQVLAGGTGLNIQRASIVIMCEPQYKPSTENQAIARSYRIGQMNNVTVYRLLCAKTVDERILQILKEKQAVFDAYANKSESGEKSLQLKEADIAEMEFADCKVV